MLNEPLCQHLAVELLKDILVLNVLEDNHALIESVLQLGLLGVLTGLLEQHRDVLGEQLGTLAALTCHLGDGVVVDELS